MPVYISGSQEILSPYLEQDRPMRALPIVGIALAIAFTAAGCSSAPASTSVTTVSAAPAAVKTATLIQPVPGTNKNKYLAGPFTLTLVHGVTHDPSGNQASEVLVENTSNDFTGYANPTVQYFQGNDVLGESNGTTQALTPGQKQTLWVPIIADLLSKDVRGQYLDAQLTEVWFGADRSQPGTHFLLAH